MSTGCQDAIPAPVFRCLGGKPFRLGRQRENSLSRPQALHACTPDNGTALQCVTDIGFALLPAAAGTRTGSYENADDPCDRFLEEGECAQSAFFPFFQKIHVKIDSILFEMFNGCLPKITVQAQS